MFDGHLCLAEFCLCNAKGHHEIGMAAQELLSVAEGAGSLAGRGLALMMGEAERLLTEAGALLAKAGASSGRVLALERLADIALLSGRKWHAKRLIGRAEGIAATSRLAPHLQIRQGPVGACGGVEGKGAGNHSRRRSAFVAAQSRMPAVLGGVPRRLASALAEMRELDQVGRRLDEAERISAMWHGGPWVAAVWDARGIQRRAENSHARAVSAFEEAASRYAWLGRPTDETRCREHVAGSSSVRA